MNKNANTNQKIFLLVLGCIVILFVTTISAHDLWLVPRKFQILPGESLVIYANTGMDFPKSLNAISPDRLDQFILVGDSIKKEISDFNIQGKSLTAKYSLEKPGSYVVAASIKPKEIKLTAKEFNEYLLHDGLGDIYKLRGNP